MEGFGLLQHYLTTITPAELIAAAGEGAERGVGAAMRAADVSTAVKQILTYGNKSIVCYIEAAGDPGTDPFAAPGLGEQQLCIGPHLGCRSIWLLDAATQLDLCPDHLDFPGFWAYRCFWTSGATRTPQTKLDSWPFDLGHLDLDVQIL